MSRWDARHAGSAGETWTKWETPYADEPDDRPGWVDIGLFWIFCVLLGAGVGTAFTAVIR